jgi:hypothetical protein
VFDLSASNNSIAPVVPILLPIQSENEMKQKVLLLRLSEVRDEFDLSASDNSIAPSLSMLLSSWSEYEMKQQVLRLR